MSICDNSGEILNRREWQIPFTTIVYWTSDSISQTNLSNVVKRDKLSLTRAGKWRFVYGSGAGVMCAIGDGRRLATAVNSKFVSDFINDAATKGSKSFASDWLSLVLNPKTSSVACAAIDNANVPCGGFSDQSQFRRWWDTASQGVSDILGQPAPHLGRTVGESNFQ